MAVMSTKKNCNATESTPTSLLFTYGVVSLERNFKTRVFEQLSNKFFCRPTYVNLTSLVFAFYLFIL